MEAIPVESRVGHDRGNVKWQYILFETYLACISQERNLARPSRGKVVLEKREKKRRLFPSGRSGGEGRVKLENENQGKLESRRVEMETWAEGGQAKSYPPEGE